MTPNDNLDQQLTTFLRDGPTTLPDPSFDAVRDRTESTPQRVGFGPRRVPDMNKFLAFGVAAAAVVVALLIGSRLVAPSTAPGTSPDGSLPAGPFVISNHDLKITVTVPGTGWEGEAEAGLLIKNGNSDPPDGAALLVDTNDLFGISIYHDPCHWSTTYTTRAGRPHAVVAALAGQEMRNATAPVAIAIDGFPGESIILHVPDDIAFNPNADDDKFPDCDRGMFATWTDLPAQGPTRWHQGPGQIDEFWVVDGPHDASDTLAGPDALVIFDLMYGPDTPAADIEELRAIVQSATWDYAGTE